MNPYWLNFSKIWPYLLLILLWYLSWWSIDNAILIPSPHATWIALISYASDLRFRESLYSTMSNLVMAWFLVQSLVLMSIMLVQVSRPVELILSKWALMFQTLPTFALLPVLIALLGFNTMMMFTLLIFANYWASMSYALTSQREVRARWSHHAENLRLSSLNQFTKIYLYAMLPHLVTMSSIAWGLCWRTLIAVEIMFGGLSTASGLGVLMQQDRQSYDTAQVWAILMVILFVSVAINQMFDFAREKITWT